MGPLERITVVSLEHAIAAPYATRQLADLGARVIKVERPGAGDFARAYDERVKGLSSHFVWCNRSKESIELDLKSEFGLTTLMRLIARADVLVQNLAPGASAGYGLDFASLSVEFPRLIVCDISGFGQGGPHCERKAYDLLIQAESGFLSITGTESETAKAGCSIADIAAGMYAYSNILAAIIERQDTGKGKHIDISMLEAMAEWLGFPMYYTFDGAAAPARTGAEHATIAPYGVFPTADGSVLFAVQNEREWEGFCRHVLQQPELVLDQRFLSNSLRTQNRAALRQQIAAALAKIDTADALRRLEAGRIASASVHDMADLWSHPQLHARNRWVQVDSSVGALPALLPPGQSSARMAGIPALGQHTRSILQELGLEQEMADA